jgi:F-type H+-transporting ATPase subunit a
LPQHIGHIQLAQAGEASATEHVAETHASQGEAEHEYRLGDIPQPKLLFANAILVAVIMVAFGIAATRKMAAIPRGVQNFGEFIVESMVNFTRGIIGPGGEKYVPLVGTVFFFIYLSNVIGLVPGFHSPTSNLSTTLALGIIVFLYVQYVGIRSRGIVGYVKHFMGPMPALAPLLMPIEIISEIVKPFTLALRLFGNIFGEDTVIIVLSSLGATMLFYVPVQFPILVLALLTTFVQALVFSLLTCIYIALQSHHDEESGHAPAAEHASHS